MERKRKAPKLRWAYFQPVTSTLVFFRLDNNEILRPDWRERRGGGTVEHAVKRQQNIGGHKFSFACYTPGSVVWELATSKNEELAKWLAALPVFISASAMPAAGQQSALAPGVKRSGSRAAAANGVGAEGGETGHGEARKTSGKTADLQEKIAELQAQVLQAQTENAASKAAAAEAAAAVVAATRALGAPVMQVQPGTSGGSNRDSHRMDEPGSGRRFRRRFHSGACGWEQLRDSAHI